MVTADEWARLVDRLALTPRQYQVLRLTFQGATQQAIAHRLRLSPHTVRQHLENLHAKLGVSDRVGLVLHVVLVRDELRVESGELLRHE